MLKRIVHIGSWVLLFAYMVVTMGAVKQQMSKRMASGFEIEIMNLDDYAFVETGEIEKILQKEGISTENKNIKDVPTDLVEDKLSSHPWLKQVECYRTVNDAIKINVWQRQPVVRIIAGGSNYYVDANAYKMPPKVNTAAYVPVVTGMAPDSVLLHDVLTLVEFIDDDSFLKSQIQQLYINSNKEFVLIPRVGKQEILFGDADRIAGKFYKLKKLYREEFGENGWNKYRIIDLRFHNQVVCTKK